MSSLPDLRALEVAAIVIEEGSMTAAGARLGMTQSAVSQAMKRAESEIGTRLVHRRYRPLAPADAGRVLLTRMREITRHAGNAVEAMRAAARCPERQELRLGMIDSFAATVGPLLARRLMDASVAVAVTAFAGLAPAHAEALRRGAIEAAVTSDAMDGRDELNRYPLLREPFVLVAPLGWADVRPDRPLTELLFARRLVRYSARSHMGMQIERHLRRLGIEHPPALSCDTSDSLLAMVAEGMGVAITTPLCLLQGITHRPALAVMPLPAPRFARTITLLTTGGERDTLGPRIAVAARTLLRERTLPRIAAEIAGLTEMTGSMVLDPPADNRNG